MGERRRHGWATEVVGLVVLVAAIVFVPGGSGAAGSSSHPVVRSADRLASSSGDSAGLIHSVSITR
jgi:hypothetical protein